MGLTRTNYEDVFAENLGLVALTYGFADTQELRSGGIVHCTVPFTCALASLLMRESKAGTERELVNSLSDLIEQLQW